MKSILSLFAVVVMVLSSMTVLGGAVTEKMDVGTMRAPVTDGSVHGKSSDPFVPNQGQVPDDKVLFQTQNAYFTDNGAIFRAWGERPPQAVTSGLEDDGPIPERFEVYSVEFVGARPVEPVGTGPLAGRSNFFLGNDPSGWASDVPNFEGILYPDLYDGIDLAYKTVPSGVKYEFRVQPGAQVSDIRVAYEGVDIDTDGSSLFIRTSVGTIVDDGLYTYELTADGQSPVMATAHVQDNVVTYQVRHDPTRTLVIDPLIHSTFIGSDNDEAGRGIALDSSNNSYIAGWTTSTTFPTTAGVYDTSHNGAKDVFVLKLNPTMSSLLYSTYIGGTDNDTALAIALDASNNAYVTGYTESTDFPTTPGAFNQTHYAWEDVFVFKLGPTGSTLVYSTYVGGDSEDIAYSIAVDKDTNAYVVGSTMSFHFPVTPGAAQGSYSMGQDAFAFKLLADGSAMAYSTYIGGGAMDIAYGVYLNSMNESVICGRTDSNNFPTSPGAYSTIRTGRADVFVLKLDWKGKNFLNATYLGGKSDDFGIAITLDSANNAYVTGLARSTDFPVTLGAYNVSSGVLDDVFVAKLDSSFSTLIFSSLIGGFIMDEGRSIALGPDDSPIVAGYTDSNDFPTTAGALYKAAPGGYDAFVLILDNTGSRLKYSTYMGGKSEDKGYSMALDKQGYIYVVGSTYSAEYPTSQNAYDKTYGGAGDVFAFKMSPTFVPMQPLCLTADGIDGGVLLDWKAPLDAAEAVITNYVIFRADDWDLPYYLLNTIGNLLHYNDTNVTNGHAYYYLVASKNVSGQGELSNEAWGLPGAPPGAPVLNLEYEGDSEIGLNWTPPDDKGFWIDNYTIFRGLTKTSLQQLDSISGGYVGVVLYEDKTAKNGTMYYYAISAINDRGEGPRSNIVNGSPYGKPSPPIGLAALEGDGFVNLSWKAPADDGGRPVIAYLIMRGDSSGNLYNIAHEAVVYNYNDTSVKNGHTYYYAVQALNTKRYGYWSSSVEATPGTGPSAPVAKVSAGDRYILVGWSVPVDDGGFPVEMYRIYSGTTPTGLSLVGNTTVCTYNDTPVKNGVVYYYAISAVNSRSEGPRSDVVHATAMGLPGTPHNVTAATGKGFVNLTWDLPLSDGGSPIKLYRIYKQAEGGSPVYSGEVNALYYIDRAVVNGTAYSYYVTAVNGVGEGVRSLMVQVIPLGPPGAVTGLTAKAGDGFVHLTWDLPDDDGGADIKAYTVYRSIPQMVYVKLQQVQATNFNDTTVTNGVTYNYRVMATNSEGEGSPSFAYATPAGQPRAPVGLKVSSKGTTVHLNWSPPTDNGGFAITGYKIYGGTSKDQLRFIGTTNGTEYIDKDVKAGKMYYYKVSAVNKKGEGKPTETLSIRVAPATAMSMTLIAAFVAIIIALVAVGVAVALRMSKKTG